MSSQNLTSIPMNYKRGVLRWVLLAFQAVPFALIVFAYPTLRDTYPEIFTQNHARLALLAWSVFLLLHLAVVCLVELVESIHIAWKFIRRRREYRRYLKQRAQKMVRWNPPSQNK